MFKKSRQKREEMKKKECIKENLHQKKDETARRKKISEKKKKEICLRIPSSKLNFNLLTSLHCFNEFHDRNENNSLYTMQMAKKDSKKD